LSGVQRGFRWDRIAGKGLLLLRGRRQVRQVLPQKPQKACLSPSVRGE